jgi:hypothetical protein
MMKRRVPTPLERLAFRSRRSLRIEKGITDLDLDNMKRLTPAPSSPNAMVSQLRFYEMDSRLPEPILILNQIEKLGHPKNKVRAFLEGSRSSKSYAYTGAFLMYMTSGLGEETVAFKRLVLKQEEPSVNFKEKCLVLYLLLREISLDHFVETLKLLQYEGQEISKKAGFETLKSLGYFFGGNAALVERFGKDLVNHGDLLMASESDRLYRAIKNKFEITISDVLFEMEVSYAEGIVELSHAKLVDFNANEPIHSLFKAEGNTMSLEQIMKATKDYPSVHRRLLSAFNHWMEEYYPLIRVVRGEKPEKVGKGWRGVENKAFFIIKNIVGAGIARALISFLGKAGALIGFSVIVVALSLIRDVRSLLKWAISKIESLLSRGKKASRPGQVLLAWHRSQTA